MGLETAVEDGARLEQTKLSHEELQQRLHKLEDAYQNCQRLSLANNFAAAVMHEVNNPLEAITNLVYLAQHDSDPLDVQNRLAMIQEQLLVLASVARSSLAFYKGQDEAQQIDLMAIAESALKLHFTRLQQKGIRVRTDYCRNTKLQGIGSEVLQVISNLILNAADALSETQHPAVTLSVRQSGSMLELSVSDNGAGVPEALEDTLFEAHATGKKTGMGMGLWLSKRIAEKHGGSISYETSRTPGTSGTTFRVALPVEE